MINVFKVQIDDTVFIWYFLHMLYIVSGINHPSSGATAAN
jgi:hypothetical protein